MSTTGSVEPPLPVDIGDDVARALCEQVLHSNRLHLLTQINGGVPELFIDTFDDSPEVSKAAEDLETLRSHCHSAARLVVTFAETQGMRLEEAHTGRLIRVVLHADGGAVFCYTVVPGQHVVGFVFHETDYPPSYPLSRQPRVNAADRAMTELADRLRQTLGLPTQNAGGWSSERHERDLPGETAADLLTAALDPVDLHYVVRLRPKQTAEVHDRFEHPSLRPHFRLITPAARRTFYHRLASEFSRTVGQVGRLARGTVGGTIRRIVLDVEQGAVCYYRLGVADYLVGVTLNQNQVGATDGKLASLALRLMR